MHQKRVCCPHLNKATEFAAVYLRELGSDVTDTPDNDAAHLLLPVPSFPACGEMITPILEALPGNILISGGGLDGRLAGYRTVDFLKDPFYLADNAAITARCAIEIVEEKIGRSLARSPVLVIGWGRIGKCLGQILHRAGANVTIAARKETDQAMIHALGQRGISTEDAAQESTHYQVILNTVPVMVLPEIETQPDAVILELASKPGMSGPHIIDARGLPGKMAPVASGKLIAKTFIRLSLGKEV